MFALEPVAFVEIVAFVVGALLFLGLGDLVSALFRPHRPTAQKTSTYESGEVPTGTAWTYFNSRLYGIALVFVLFEMETVLLFPWATVWNDALLNAETAGWWRYYTALSAVLFIALLALGLLYVWRQGYFNSIMLPQERPLPTTAATVPHHYYEQVNSRYASVEN